MSDGVRLRLSAIEAAHLRALVEQFADLVATGDDARLDDPAIARLVPDAYREDPAAAREFRRLTQSDLLDRRRDDAALVLATLSRDGAIIRADDLADAARARAESDVRLDDGEIAAWLRTLAAIRLVMAVRLGIDEDDDRLDDGDDARYGVYDWVGYRLDGLLRAIDR